MLLYVIRHGDPIYDPDCLTEKGKLQAQALARRLAVHGLDRIFTSPLVRARQTAEPTCQLLGIQPSILEWTSEALAWHYFSVETEDGHRTWPFHTPVTRFKNPQILAMDNWYDVPPFSTSRAKEGYTRLSEASDAFTEELGYKREGLIYRITRPNEERVAVFCHQGFGLSWLSYLLGITPPLFWSSFDVTHSSVTLLHFANHPDGFAAPTCLALSDVSHIYADRLPLQYNNHLDI